MKIFKPATVLLLAALTQWENVSAQVKKIPAKNGATSPKPPSLVKVPVKKVEGVRVKISTALGDVVVSLSNKTPQHRDNFLKLVNSHFYDSLLFHRVINGFMIQGGDPQSKNAAAGTMLGSGDVGYTIPAEFDTSLFHKRGALAAARNNNPEKASSGCQFYIVQGKKITDAELDMIEMRSGQKFSPAKRMTYKMNGGTPFLDMNYTVFGQVESGMEVIEKIALLQVDGNNRPLNDISMKMQVVKEEGK